MSHIWESIVLTIELRQHFKSSACTNSEYFEQLLLELRIVCDTNAFMSSSNDLSCWYKYDIIFFTYSHKSNKLR